MYTSVVQIQHQLVMWTIAWRILRGLVTFWKQKWRPLIETLIHFTYVPFSLQNESIFPICCNEGCKWKRTSVYLPKEKSIFIVAVTILRLCEVHISPEITICICISTPLYLYLYFHPTVFVFLRHCICICISTPLYLYFCVCSLGRSMSGRNPSNIFQHLIAICDAKLARVAVAFKQIARCNNLHLRFIFALHDILEPILRYFLDVWVLSDVEAFPCGYTAHLRHWFSGLSLSRALASKWEKQFAEIKSNIAGRRCVRLREKRSARLSLKRSIWKNMRNF